MPRLVSLVDRDPKTYRIDKVIVYFKDAGRRLEIKVIPINVEYLGRKFVLEMMHEDGNGTVRVLAESGMDILDMRAIRDGLTKLLDEHFDVAKEKTAS